MQGNVTMWVSVTAPTTAGAKIQGEHVVWQREQGVEVVPRGETEEKPDPVPVVAYGSGRCLETSVRMGLSLCSDGDDDVNPGNGVAVSEIVAIGVVYVRHL